MMAPTHITFAEFVYLLLLTTTGVSLNLVNSTVVAVSSLLPDVDTETSLMGKCLPFISCKLERKFGHRTLTHSAICLVLLGIMVLPLWFFERDVYICLLAGYGSHPFLDTMTVNGVQLFYPFSTAKCVFPFEVNNPHRYRVQTGSKTDRMLSWMFAAASVPALVIALQGYERFVRSTQQNIEAAVRDYNEFSKNHLVLAHVEAYNALTRQPLRGRVEIIGALNPQTLVFRHADGQPHTLGKEFQADYVVENILCSQGARARSSIRNVDLSSQLLSQVSSYADSSAENYFFGDLSTTDRVSLPENIRMFTPVTGSGGTIRLNYATFADIRAFNLEFVYITKGIVTIRSVSTLRSPGDVTPSHPDLPMLENFARISAALDPGDSVDLIRQKGDTVYEKDLLARKILTRLYDEEIHLNEEKITALRALNGAALADIDKKISIAAAVTLADSLEYHQNIELSENRYIPPSTLDASRLKLDKDNQVLSGLISSRAGRIQESGLELRKLEIVIAELKAKARSAQMGSEIRSTAGGVLVDVRRLPHDNKTQLTFIIKRIQ